MTISALSQHGNPLHPHEGLARAHHETWRRTLELAERLEVDTVIAFSGCPGDQQGTLFPNWVTCAWPGDYAEVLRWQWEERVLPYWTRETEVARSHGVRVAIEPHAGFVVHSPDTLLRLRAAGYEGALSVEHEDPRRTRDEGLARGIEVLRRVLHRVA